MHRKDHWERVFTTKGEARRQLVGVLPASHTMFPLFSIAYRPGRFHGRTHPRLIDPNVSRSCGFVSTTAASARRESTTVSLGK